MQLVRMKSSKGRCGLALGALLIVVGLAACTTTRRAADLVIDHHVGMVRGAWDIMSGEAEVRAQRLAKLQNDLDASRTALAAEQDQTRLVELLKQHASVQDALIQELLHGGGHDHGQQQQAKAQQDHEQAEHQHEH